MDDENKDVDVTKATQTETQTGLSSTAPDVPVETALDAQPTAQTVGEAMGTEGSVPAETQASGETPPADQPGDATVKDEDTDTPSTEHAGTGAGDEEPAPSDLPENESNTNVETEATE